MVDPKLKKGVNVILFLARMKILTNSKPESELACSILKHSPLFGELVSRDLEGQTSELCCICLLSNKY